MTIDEQRIGAELRRMAAEARPVDALAHARRARNGALRRRRAAWSLAGLAAAASLVTPVAVTVSSGGPGPDIAVEVARLPENTPEQLQVVRECMPNGGPVHNMDGKRRLPEQGSAEDFRVLAEYQDEKGMTALVGSLAGFVLCTPTTQKDMAERAIFTYWGFKPPGDLTGFQGDLQVDAYTSHTHSYATGPQRIQHDDVYRVVVGRVTSGVRRVEIDWADGRRTDARLAGGFFIARMPGKVGPTGILESPPVTVTAYGSQDQVLGRQQDVAFGPLGRGSGY
ncbi:hypothetical protein AB0K16_49995 [Nonomuraea jabiensis]|uniref:hypothetical protein n=1 Tax=Nonomuraea jabiensis TaxID=882448 RepID=UPI0034394520